MGSVEALVVRALAALGGGRFLNGVLIQVNVSDRGKETIASVIDAAIKDAGGEIRDDKIGSSRQPDRTICVSVSVTVEDVPIVFYSIPELGALAVRGSVKHTRIFYTITGSRGRSVSGTKEVRAMPGSLDHYWQERRAAKEILRESSLV